VVRNIEALGFCFLDWEWRGVIALVWVFMAYGIDFQPLREEDEVRGEEKAVDSGSWRWVQEVIYGSVLRVLAMPRTTDLIDQHVRILCGFDLSFMLSLSDNDGESLPN
jgi:hypothetical protein